MNDIAALLAALVSLAVVFVGLTALAAKRAPFFIASSGAVNHSKQRRPGLPALAGAELAHVQSCT
jgi:hypothetical protein